MLRYRLFFLFLGVWTGLIYTLPAAWAEEPEALLILPIKNGIKYVEKIEAGRFLLQRKDRFRLKAYVAPRTRPGESFIDYYRLQCKGSGDSDRMSGNGTVEMECKLPGNGLDTWEYPQFLLRYRHGISLKKTVVKAWFSLLADDGSEFDLVGAYPSGGIPLKLVREIDFDAVKFRPKSYSYLIRRELGLAFDDAWRYAQDGPVTVIQRRFRLPFSKAQAVNFYFDPKRPLQRINLLVDTNGDGRKDQVLLYEKLVKHRQKEGRLLVESIDLLATAKKLGLDPGKTDLLEIVVFMPGASRKILRRMPLKSVRFFKIYIPWSEDGNPDVTAQKTRGAAHASRRQFKVEVKAQRRGKETVLSFDLQKALDGQKVFSARIKDVRLEFQLPAGVPEKLTVQEAALFSPAEANYPLVLNKVWNSLQGFVRTGKYPFETTPAYDLLWYEDWHYAYPSRLLISSDTHRPPVTFRVKKGKYQVFKGNLGTEVIGFFPRATKNARFEMIWKGLAALRLEKFKLRGNVDAWIGLGGQGRIFWSPIKRHLVKGALRLEDVPKGKIYLLVRPRGPNTVWKLKFARACGLEREKEVPEGIKGMHKSDYTCFNPAALPLSLDPWVGKVYRIGRQDRLLFRKDLSIRLAHPVFLSCSYQGKANVRAKIVVEENGVSRVMAVLLPPQRGIQLPFSRKRQLYLKRIELYASPRGVNSPLPFQGERLVLKDIALVSLRTRQSDLKGQSGPIYWFEKKKTWPLNGKKIYLVNKSDENPEVRLDIKGLDLSLLNDACYRLLALKIPFEVVNGILDEASLVIGKRTFHYHPGRARGVISLPLWPNASSLRESGKAVLSGRIMRNTLADPAVFILGHVSVEGAACRVTGMDILKKDTRQSVFIDNTPITCPARIPGKQDDILWRGGWLESLPFYLNRGEHHLRIATPPYFEIKAVTLEPEGVYSFPAGKVAGEEASPVQKAWGIILKILKVVVLVGALWFTWWKRDGIKRIVALPIQKLLRVYAFLPGWLWAIVWSISAISLYGAGMGIMVRAPHGENYFWTFGGLALVLAYHHLIMLSRSLLLRKFPKISGYIYRGPGTPYIAAFIFILFSCALFLAVKLEPVAEQLAIIGYYLLVIGVTREFLALKPPGKSNEKDTGVDP